MIRLSVDQTECKRGGRIARLTEPGKNLAYYLLRFRYDPAMDSAEVERLSLECQRLRRVYAASVSRLFDLGGMATPIEYLRLKICVDDARRDLDIVKGMLEKVESEELLVQKAEF